MDQHLPYDHSGGHVMLVRLTHDPAVEGSNPDRGTTSSSLLRSTWMQNLGGQF